MTASATGGAGLELDAVSKHYRTAAGLLRAVEAVTVEVPAGSSLAIVGPSGSGKSTLLALIGALEVPTSGRIVLGGAVLSNLSERERARVRREAVGFVFQADNLLPFLTAAENVALPLAHRPADDGDRRGVELLEAMGLDGSVGRLPDQLSGGQRQRVAVARALAGRPRLILADEPTGSLDGANSAGIVDLLLTAQRETGATLIVVTHDPSVACRLSRTITLRDGRIAADSARPTPHPMPLPPPLKGRRAGCLPAPRSLPPPRVAQG